MLMPPKKSKAARKSNLTENDDEEVAVTKDALVEEVQNGNENDEDESEDREDYFTATLVDGKRKRSTPQAEKTLRDWLTKHFVPAEDDCLSIGDMHSAYVEACSSMFGVIEFRSFVKMTKELFPKGLSLAENSPYADVIKKKKKKKAKKDASGTSKSPAHFQLKQADIKEAITELGNPRKGLHFNVIQRCLKERFPALQVGHRSDFIKKVLMREVYYAHIECVRGVGACGVYRLPRTKDEEANEIEQEKKIKKEKEAEKRQKLSEENGKTEDNEVNKKNDANEVDNGTASENDGVDKEAGGQTAEVAAGVIGHRKKKKSHHKPGEKQKRKPKKKQKHAAYTGEQRRIEDMFPLAVTYNSEPKQASGRKILKYLQQHYYNGDDSIDHKVKRCLESGTKIGYWELVSGTSFAGSYCLTIEAFDPTADDDLTGQIMNAIVACTEPKVSSARLLKQYIVDYHPEFLVLEKPNQFKFALQRAIKKNILVQVTGIGASGSFQLATTFTPSPSVLQGNSLTDEVDDDRSSTSDIKDINDAKLYRDAYVPRPSKRGGGRRSATIVSRFDPSLPNPKASTVASGHRKKLHKPSLSGKTSNGKRGRGRPRLSESQSHRRKQSSESSEDESEDSEESETEQYTPRKSKSRGGAITSTSHHKKTASASQKGRVAQKKKVESEDSDNSEPEEYTPIKSKSRGGAKQTSHHKKAEPSSAKGQKKKAESEDSDDSEPEEYTPIKSKSRGGAKQTSHHKKAEPSSAKGRFALKRKIESVESDESEDEEDAPKKSSTRDDGISKTATPLKPVKGRGRPKKNLAEKLKAVSMTATSKFVEKVVITKLPDVQPKRVGTAGSNSNVVAVAEKRPHRGDVEPVDKKKTPILNKKKKKSR